jgi:hypothetical protein
MANLHRAIFIHGGLITQLEATDTLQLSNIDTAAAGALVIGNAVATSVGIASAGSACTTVDVGTAASVTSMSLGGAGLAALAIGTGMAAGDVINVAGPTPGTPSGATINLNANVNIAGVLTEIGTSAFTDAVLFKGPVTIGYAEVVTIAAASNLEVLPQATIHASSVAGFAAGGGNIYVTTSTGEQTVAYTGVSGNDFTGCTGGTGTMLTGDRIGNEPIGTDTITFASGTRVVSSMLWSSATGGTIGAADQRVIGAGAVFTVKAGGALGDASVGGTLTLSGGVGGASTGADVGGVGGLVVLQGGVGGVGSATSSPLDASMVGDALSPDITVLSTTGFGDSGYLNVPITPSGTAQVTYTSKTGTTFQGCGYVAVETIDGSAAISQSIYGPASAITAPSIGDTVPGTAGGAGVGIIAVTSSTGFASAGSIDVPTTTGPVTIAYTGKTATTFTGCTGGSSEVMDVGNITQSATSTTNMANTSTAISIVVDSTAAFPASGIASVPISPSGTATFTFTSKNVDGVTFDGCFGAVGTMAAGNVIALSDPAPGVGGSIQIKAGAAGAAGTGVGHAAGGSILIQSGAATSSLSADGTITLDPRTNETLFLSKINLKGDSNTRVVSDITFDGATHTISTTEPTAAGAGANLNLFASDAHTSGAGGDVNVTAGRSRQDNIGGSVILTGGMPASSIGIPGHIYLRPGFRPVNGMPSLGGQVFFGSTDITAPYLLAEQDGAVCVAKIAAGSDGQALPFATIYANTTLGFPSAGSILVTTDAGVQTVSYTSITGGGTASFNGCTGGTGVMATNGAILSDTGVGFHVAETYGTMQFRNRGGVWADIGAAAPGGLLPASTLYGQVLRGNGVGGWTAETDISLDGTSGSRTISVGPISGSGAGNNLTILAADGHTSGGGGSVFINAGQMVSTGVNGNVTIGGTAIGNRATLVNIGNRTDVSEFGAIAIPASGAVMVTEDLTFRAFHTGGGTRTIMVSQPTSAGSFGDTLRIYGGLAPASTDTTLHASMNTLTLPQATIYVASITGFATAGKIAVTTSLGKEQVTYTGVAAGSPPSFTGCSGGTGVMSTGGAVSSAIAGGSVNIDGGAKDADGMAHGNVMIGTSIGSGDAQTELIAIGTQGAVAVLNTSTSGYYPRPAVVLAFNGMYHDDGTPGGNTQLVMGKTTDDLFALYANKGTGTAQAGIRYNDTTKKWQIQSTIATWSDITAGSGVLPISAIDYQVLQNVSGSATWESDITLPNDNTRTIKVALGATGVQPYGLVLQGGDALDSNLNGGSVSIRGGSRDGSGTHGVVYLGDTQTSKIQIGSMSAVEIDFLGHANNRIISDITFKGDAARTISVATSATGQVGRDLTITAGSALDTNQIGGNITIQGGAAVGSGAGGDARLFGAAAVSTGVAGLAYVAGGASASSAAAGNVLIFGGDNSSSGAGGDVKITAGASTSGTAGSTRIYGKIILRAVSAAYATLDFVPGTAATPLSSVISDVGFSAAADRQIFIADAASGIGRHLTLTAGKGASGSVGGTVYLYGAASASSAAAGDASIRGGDASSSGAAGDIRVFAGDGTASTANGGNVLIRGGTTTGGTAGKACIYGDVKFESPNTTTPAQIDFVGGAGNSRVVSNIVFKNDAAYSMYIADSDTARALTIHSTDAISATNTGGAVTLRSGNGLTSGAGGLLTIQGGSSSGAGAGGSVQISGGASASGTTGSVYLAYTTATDLYFGAGTNGLYYASGVLSAIGTGSINLPIATGGSSVRFQIGGVAVTSAAITATNFDTLFNGGDASALHTHAGAGTATETIIATTTGEAVTVGMAVGIEVATTSKTFKVDTANAGTRHFVLGLAAASVGSGGSLNVVTSGEVSIGAGSEAAVWDTAPGIGDVGKLVWASMATPGKLTFTPPTTVANYKTKVGILTFAGAGSRVAVQIGDPMLL